MKTPYLICTTFLIVLFCLSCKNEKVTSTDNRLDSKHGPSEEFFLQRMDPDGNFSIKAYIKGLKQAKQYTQIQSRSIDGFDNDWTVQGPGNIGGRINTIAVNPLDEDIIYAGFARGGVFKTTDGGGSWVPIFDDQLFSSIGDITLDPQDPNIVYVGTGDPNISGSPSIGDGVYKSENGGATWTHLGLDETRIISHIVVDPTDGDRVFASAMGLPFQRNDDRGLYRTENGGTTWEQVLFLSDSTGIIDLIMDPQQPNVMYAAGWDRIRNNTESIVSGDGAKVFKTTDGGDTWNMLEGGLPNEVPNGRIGLAICESQPNVIYAQYANPESTLEAIYRSDDSGENWYLIPSEVLDYYDEPINLLGGFAWYFGKIRVSPSDPDDIYLLGVDLWRSQDAGQSWAMASPIWWLYEVHADKHELVYLNDESILLGTDGGMYASDKENIQWVDTENIPTNQFYRVAYNPHQPDLYYGGAQDNGSTGGNQNTINNWERIYGGDGFQMRFDPVDPQRFFVEIQNGSIRATYDGGYLFTNANDGIEPDDPRNWDMPYFISVHDETKMVTGTNRLYVNRAYEPVWEPLTDDLTDGADGETRNKNITAIHESPINEDFVIAGTGDGNIWIGDLNDGNSFTKVSDNLPNQYVTDVFTSDDNPNRIFACHSGYRDNDNNAMIFRSDDLGSSWSDISGDLPEVAINEILIIPETEDKIIFIGTDAGVYGTTDGGTIWERLGSNMTFVPVYDLVWNEANNELVAATFGRSIQTYDLDPIVDTKVDVATNPIKQESITKAQVYPTLSSDLITVEYFNIEPNKNSSIAIVSSSGQLVQILEDISDREVRQTIDVSQLPAGQYFVKIKVRHSVRSVGFVKE